MSTADVSVIIVNWNGKAFLEECLSSLASQRYQNFEVILVDNGSDDGSSEYVVSSFPWVRIVALHVNSGFAAGNNAGYEHSSGKYIVTLNNDTKVDENWLEELVKTADSDEEVGMVASCICQYFDPTRVDSLGVRICADGMSRGAFRFNLLADVPLLNCDEVLVPSACAALYKRDMIEAIGFFDEDYFAYCEDTDLGLRGRLAGWKAIIARHALVFHKYSMTGGSFSPFKLYLVERNHFWLAIKCLPLSHLLLLPWSTLLRYLLQARLVRTEKGSGGDFRGSSNKKACLQAFLRGIVDALNGIPRAVVKRNWIMNNKKMSIDEYSDLLKKFEMRFEELLDVS